MGNWGNQITTFVVFIVLTRLLDPQDFGLVAMASVFTSFMALFTDQGLSQAIVQRSQLDPGHLNAAFWTNVFIGSSLALLGILLAGVVSNIYNEPHLRPIVATLSMTFIFSALGSTQQALLQRSLNFRALSIRQLIAAISGGIAGIVLALLGAGAYALVGKSLIMGLVGVVVLWNISDWRPGLSFSRRHLRDLLGFGMSMVGVKITNFFKTRLDDFLIGFFLGAEALGFYTIAYRLGRLTLDMFTGVMSKVALTTFARLQNHVNRLRGALYKFSSMAGMITFPVFMGLAVLAPELVVALAGEQWLPSVPAMRVLSIAGFSLSLQYFLAYLLIALGNPNRLFSLNLIVLLVTAIAFFVSARHGILYVALAYTVVNILFYGVYVAVVHRMFPLDLRDYLSSGWRFFIPSAVMGVILIVLNSYLRSTPVGLYPRLILDIAMGAGVYIAMIFIMYRGTFMETRDLVLSVNRFSRRAMRKDTESHLV